MAMTPREETDPAPLMAQALALHRAGRRDEAAELFERVLAVAPGNPDAHNLLAVACSAQGRIAEAFRHARRACELAAWRFAPFNQNFSYVVRIALANADAGRAAAMREAYARRFGPRGREAQAMAGASISVLLFAAEAGPAIDAVREALGALPAPVGEVLVPADLAGRAGARAPGWPLRIVEGAAVSIHERINSLARAAGGTHLLALAALPARGEASQRPAALRQLVPFAGRWTVGAAMEALGEGMRNLLAEAPTPGLALLSRERLVADESRLLVPRELHERAGGYRPASPDPLQDYCLRLLWQAEPALSPVPAIGDGSPPAPAGDEARLAAVDAYLRIAFTNAPAPNPFAPSRHGWGLRLHDHVARQSLFAGSDWLSVMNDDIDAHLTHLAAQPIPGLAGVNLVGPVRGELGLGENMRAIARACLDEGIPCSLRDVSFAMQARHGDASLEAHLSELAVHRSSVFFLNPDCRWLYDKPLDGAVFHRPTLDFRHRKIGYWFWELDRVPPAWSAAIEKVDEIWVASEFVAQAVRNATPKDVIKIPPPISVPQARAYDRAHYGLPERTFLFLFSFDYHSGAERKNPWALVRAFRKAFGPERRDVALVIKTVNGNRHPDAVAGLLDAAGHDPRVLLRDGFLDRDEVAGLQAVADAYASLHRSEGFGLGLAESMFLGKPAIGTAYSGNLEFMRAENSALVDCRLVPVGPGEYVHAEAGLRWAEPDEHHAASLMRRLVDDRPWAATLAARGRDHILRHFSSAATAALIRARLGLAGPRGGRG